MGINTQVNGRKIEQMGTECMNKLMERNTKANGRMIFSMGREKKYVKLVIQYDKRG